MASTPNPFERVRRWRAARKLSQFAASELLGCNQSVYCLIENGERRPALALIEAINREVGTTWEEWAAAKTKRQRARAGKAA